MIEIDDRILNAPNKGFEDHFNDPRLKEGMVLEFGVASGGTINRIADILKDRTIYGFDSFEGIPEDWRPDILKGNFACSVPEVRENVKLVIGMFNDTLPTFLQTHTDLIAAIHMDADLYSSTKTVFDNVKNQLVDGCIILFDEFMGYGGWEEHEAKAFFEFIEETGYKWECISKGGEQVSFIITK